VSVIYCQSFNATSPLMKIKYYKMMQMVRIDSSPCGVQGEISCLWYFCVLWSSGRNKGFRNRVTHPCPVGRSDGELWGVICPDIQSWITCNVLYGKMALCLLSVVHIPERHSPSSGTINSSSSLPWCLMETEIGPAERATSDAPTSFVRKGGVAIFLIEL
jgi:hypothetical protein